MTPTLDHEHQGIELSGSREQAIDVGAGLRRAREQKGLSVESVAADLHTDSVKLEALEANDYDAFPSAVFVKGFIRNYARAVEIDPAPLVNAYERLSDSGAPPLTPVTKVAASTSVTQRLALGKAGRYAAMVLALVVLVWLSRGVYTFVNELRKSDEVLLPSLQLSDDAVAVPSLALPPPPPQNEAQLDMEPSSSVADESPPPVIALEDETEAVIEQEAADASPESTEQTPAPALLSQLTFSFSEDSWVEVLDARGSRLLTRVGKAGSTVTVSGIPPFDVVLGYSPGVALQHNGEPFDFKAFNRGQVARFRVGDR